LPPTINAEFLPAQDVAIERNHAYFPLSEMDGRSLPGPMPGMRKPSQEAVRGRDNVRP
jgi:hypothetical protein